MDLLLLKLLSQNAIPFVGFHPGGDVGDQRDEVHQVALLVTHPAHRQITPDQMTLGMDVLLDHPVGVDAAFQDGGHFVLLRIQVFRPGEFLPVRSIERRGVVAEELSHRLVDLRDATFR